ncbi:MAG TPA: putative baseplate assembly protein [Burkholderiaceae bacterium]|nr:putative baseplate assembly protein [Burkholderiaceae bacterium]
MAKPSLDNRSFDQLVAEGLAQIPRLAPAWSDHNASDPGITLLELAAWLAEQNIYRYDRPSEEALRGFAQLVLDDARREATVASTVVAVSNTNPVAVELPARIQLATDAAEAFETRTALHASPAQLVQVAWHTAGGVRTDATNENDGGALWWPLGPRPRRGAALVLGFDRALDAAGATLSLHLWTDTWIEDACTRQRLQAEHGALVAHLTAVCPPCTWQGDAGAAHWRHHYRAATVWEFDAGGGVWKPLQDVVDDTRALTLSGFVRFTAPVGHQASNGVWRVRCRLRRSRYECAPRALQLVFNAVEAEHALSRSERSLGPCFGRAHPVIALGEAPIVDGATVLCVDDGGGNVQTDWKVVTEWDRCGPHDRCVRVDPVLGLLYGGDGLRGEVLPAGFELFAAYRVGGGRAGNLSAGSLTRVPGNVVNDALTQPVPISALPQPLAVLQPFAATGGRPREALRALQSRAVREATSVDKAVTLADFERLALAAPGLPVARVRAFAGSHPSLPCWPAPGVVQLIVVPRCGKPAPMPSRALLDAVARYLEPRRLVTSELHVRPPRYRRLAVHATLHIDCTAHEANDVLREANTRLDAYLDALIGGPDGTGWPIGRPVYRNELLALLAGLSGVARVSDLGLNGPCGQGACCGNVVLCDDELVRPGKHRLRIQSAQPLNLRRSDAHVCDQDRPCA